MESIHDHVKEHLKLVLNGNVDKVPEKQLNELKKRKLVAKEYVKIHFLHQYFAIIGIKYFPDASSLALFA